MKKIIALLLLVFSAIQVQAGQKVVFKTYTDSTEKVSIKYPATWQNEPYSSEIFKFLRPVEEPGQKMRENINLVVGPADDLELIEYLEDARRKYKTDIEGFKELRSEYIKVNGLEFVRMVYQFNLKGFVIKSVLYLTVHNSKAYSLNCTALDTTFDRFYPLFQTMAESFRIK